MSIVSDTHIDLGDQVFGDETQNEQRILRILKDHEVRQEGLISGEDDKGAGITRFDR